MTRGLSFICALLVACSFALTAHAADGIFDEVRLGVLAHDVQVLGGREHGADLNAELQFNSPVPSDWGNGLPTWMRFVLQPRPTIGGNVNTGGATSEIYAGFTWTALRIPHIVSATDAIVFDLGVGGSLNNGYTNSVIRDRKSLGSNALFRLTAELGYEITPRIAIYALYEHDSNAGLARNNEALNDIGLRIGFKF